MGTRGYVYLICDANSNMYKIGMTKGTIEKRIKTLQTGNANELHIVKYYHTDFPFKMESMLHLRFKWKQVLNEWFDLTDDDVFDFEQTCKDVENAIIALKDNPFFAKNGLN